MPRPTKYTTTAGEQLWEIRYRLPGGTSTRKRGFRTAREAREWWDETGSKIAEGNLSSARDGRATVSERCAKFLLGYDHRDASVKHARVCVNYILSAFGDWPIRDVQSSDLREWQKRFRASVAPRTGKPYADATVRDAYYFFSQILDAAVLDGILTRSPANKTNRPPKSKSRKACPPIGQIDALAAAMEPRYRIAVWLMAGAGLRAGEAVGLRQSDLDLTLGSGLIRVRVQHQDAKTKSDRERDVPIPDWLVEDLTIHLHDHPDPMGKHVLSNMPGKGRGGGQCGYSNLYLKFQKAIEAVPDWPENVEPMHGLRHFYNSHQKREGLSDREVSDAMGHVTLDMQETYQHSLPGWEDRVRAAAVSIRGPRSGNGQYRT